MITFEKNEHIIMEIRKHWIVYASEIATMIILSIVPLFVLAVIKNSGIELVFERGDFYSFVTFLYSLWLFILWITAFIFWTNYYLDVWVLTNQRVLDIEQRGMFSREVSILHLDKVQDISYEVSGLVASIFDFGDIHIQTAATESQFVIKGVPNPAYIQKKLNESVMRSQNKL